MNDLIIIGAGGFGREVSWLVENINKKEPTWNLLGFVDDDPSINGKVIDDYPVLGGMDWLSSYNNPVYVACSIAKPSVRELLINKCKLNNLIQFATLIDPQAIVGKQINMGLGCIVSANSVIPIDVHMDDFVIVTCLCYIGHDTVLHEFTTLYPAVSVAGHVTIGPYTEIGTGSQVIQGLSVGRNAIVGAGSVVVKDIPSYCTAVGVPAKPIKNNSEMEDKLL